jgi:sugar transferase (PEP-CTERM/EpsH1 system associated)
VGNLNQDPSRTRVLQFAPRVCWPLDTGAKLRNHHLARVLSGPARVALLAFSESARSASELEIYEEVVTVPRSGGYSFGNVLRGAVGSTPLPLLNYTSEEMKRALARVLDQNEFDLVQVESIHLMNYLPIIRAARSRPLAVCDWHNVESDLMRQYAESERNVARKAYARRTARLLSKFEERALTEFDAHLTVSEHDAERLRSVNPQARILVIENGVDVAHFANDESTAKSRIVFVGSMDYHANIEGATSFARNVWPGLHAKKPELKFTIVGRDPTAAVRELSSINGVDVTGSVEDVRPYYCEAIAAVVPLNVGGGSRLKVLEAMAAGVPVVSTTRGAEGLTVQNGVNILLEDSNQKFVDAILSVADDQELRKRIIAGGRALVSERYDWSTIGATLFDHYQELISERSAAVAQ